MSDSNLIKTVIKARNVTYYLTTEEDLNEIKSKSILGDISILLFSLLVGGAVSIKLTQLSLSESSKNYDYFNLLFWACITGTIITFIAGFYFYYSSFSLIKKIKGSGEIKSLNSEQTISKEEPKLEILSGLYWTPKASKDVTNYLLNKITNNKLSIRADNSLVNGEDPEHSVVKKLTITYRYNGINLQREYTEGDDIKLPG